MAYDVDDQGLMSVNTSIVKVAQSLVTSYLTDQSNLLTINNTNISVINNNSIGNYYSLEDHYDYSGNQLISDTSYNYTSLNNTTNVIKSDEDKLSEFMSDLRSQVLIEKIIYASLFVIGSFGNMFVLYNLFQPRFKSKMNYLIRHLAVADLMVIFLTVGVELIWRITIKWETGELGCKIVQFWRIFPLYLTSLMMICISLDRFYAFVFPLTIFKSKERNFYLIITSYVVSFVASIPQVRF